MTRRMLHRRLRARLSGERGFTIVETMIAIVVVFGSLTALAYTATIGFKYIAQSRDRVQATGVANQIMEGVRALPYTNVTNGMSTAELAGDTRIAYCSGEGVYRLEDCTTGEKIVSSTFAPGYSAEWLVPHSDTITTDVGLELEWSTYVTNEDVAANPYAVTVLVSWSAGAIPSGNNLVRLQSHFWSPTGCVSSTTHPFAAPCQPFLYGHAQVPESAISIVGQLHDYFVDFEEGTIELPSADALGQQEQTSDLDASTTTGGLSVVDSGGRENDGGVQTAWSADSDPSSSAGGLAGGSATAGLAAYLERLQPDAGGSIGLQLTVPAGDTGSAGATVEALAADAYACPPSGTRETDGLACVASQERQAGTVTASVPFTHVAAIGPANVVRITAPGTDSKATVDRDASATSGDDGLVDVTASRSLGTIYIGGFPTSGMTAPAGMSTTATADNNYCLRITGYADTVRAISGERTATAPSASASGTFHYYDSVSTTYLNRAVTNATLDTLTFSCTKTQSVSGSTVRWTVSVSTAGDIVHATTSTSQTTEVDPQIKLDTEARATPVQVTVRYLVEVGPVEEVDLTVTLDLGTLLAEAVYEPPPPAQGG